MADRGAQLPEGPKIRQIWNSVPEQLARENNKFIFSHEKKGHDPRIRKMLLRG